MTTRFLTAFFLLLVATAEPVAAQGRSAPVVTLGGIAGGAVGFLGGALLGGSITGRGCEPGNPDACLGESLPGYVWGAGVGMTVGIPTGAHLANSRAGNYAKTLGASALIFGIEVVALNLLVDDGRTRNKGLTFGIAVAAPIIQLITSVALERDEATRR